MVLYRKYRPQKFSEIVGQEHIKKILTNSIIEDKVAHAYLFSGPRGVGKTTIARLLAKSLNCKNRKKDSAEPCGECLSCKEVTDDRNLDVIEIDAASNRGIDEIRELREKIRFSPTGSKYKIYIIDEVHMLTREAFNALLKTLEEPPKHAIFIMATTELHKVPDTIISRSCQLDFKKASKEEIIESLKNVCKKEKIEFDDSALEFIAESASGGFRDALSLLGQVISVSSAKIDSKTVSEILGLPPKELVTKFGDYLIKKDSKNLFEIINQISSRGYDFDQFVDFVISNLRDKMIKTQDKQIFILINMLLEAKENLKISPVDVLPLELMVVQLCGKESEVVSQLIEQTSKEAVVAREIRLSSNEARIGQRLTSASARADESSIEKRKTKNESTNTESTDNELTNQPITDSAETKKESNKAIKPFENTQGRQYSNVTIDLIKSKWQDIRNDLKKENHSISMILAEAQPVSVEDGIIELSISNKFYADKLKEPKKYQIIAAAIEQNLGVPLGFECEIQSVKKSQDDNNLVEAAKEVFDL